jgi:His/Glu/Gln/Arg/opine family amino acid ABC transporter permease subunit
MMQFLQSLLEHLPQWGPRLLPAIGNTALITIASFCLALALAVVVEFLRSLRIPLLVRPIVMLMEILRSVPILAVLYLIYFGLPGIGITLSPFAAGTIGLGAVYCAYLSEVLRAGIGALHRGQREAALAVGMTPLMAFRVIVLPQAVRIMLAPLLVSLISLMKDSSICALIAVNELMLESRLIMSEYFLPMHIFVLVGLVYFSIAWPMSLFAGYVERRLNRERRTSAPARKKSVWQRIALRTAAE